MQSIKPIRAEMAEHVRHESLGTALQEVARVYPNRASYPDIDHSFSGLPLRGGILSMKIHRNIFALLIIVLVVGFGTSCRRNDEGVQAAREEKKRGEDNKDVLTAADRQIAMQIEQEHQAEVDLAKLAQQRATNKDVKDYAGNLVDDHNAALKDIQNMIRDKQTTESTQSTPMKSSEAQAAYTKLQGLSGTAFDREFINMMVQDHQKMVDELNRDQGKIQNADLKNHVRDLISKDQKHLEQAQDLQRKLSTGERLWRFR
jgi:putative membrane protein